MRAAHRLGVGLLFALLVLPVHSQSTGTAAVSGVVVDARTSQPISGALVALEQRLPGRMSGRPQVTSPKGRFALANLPAGEAYVLTVTKTGYLAGGLGRADPRGPATPFALKDGQWLSDVRLTLAPPGAIGGTILDERGEPVVGAFVRVLAQVLMGGRVQWLAGTVAVTDDRGAYRIAGLGPGKYVVCVPSVQATLPVSSTIKKPTAGAGSSQLDLNVANAAAAAERLVLDGGNGQQLIVGRFATPPASTADGALAAYPVTFYPNAPTPADAAAVELGVSEDRSGIDIQLQPVRTSRISGVVQGPPEAVGNLLLRLVPAGLEDLGQGSEAATTVTLADGRFTFLAVPAGSYVLDTRHSITEFTYTSTDNMLTVVPAPVPFPARSASSSSLAAAPYGVSVQSLSDGETAGYFGQMRVDVGTRNLDNVVVPLHQPGSVSGRIEWAPGVTPPSSVPTLTLDPAEGRRSLVIAWTGFSMPTGPTFTVGGMMPAEYFLRAPRGVTVESITWDGQDYTDRPFDGRTGRHFADVVVTLTTFSSSVNGVVNDAGASISSGAAVIAFPAERERWSKYGLNPPRLKSVLASIDGRYRIEGLPVGDYYFLAVPVVQERAWLDPAFLAARAARATRVRIDRSDASLSGIVLGLVK